MLFKKGRIKFPDIKKEQISFCSLIYICHSFLIGVLPSQLTFFQGFNIKNEVAFPILYCPQKVRHKKSMLSTILSVITAYIILGINTEEKRSAYNTGR